MSAARLRGALTRVGIGILILASFGWALSRAPLVEMLEALRQLRLTQIVILVVVNLTVVAALSGRWWSLLRGLGHATPILRVMQFRLAGFAVSYFTPGPQFGGEPLQVLLLRNRQKVPASIGSASVALDKAIELMGNFGFLVFGAIVLLRLRLLPEIGGAVILTSAVFLSLLPIGLMLAWRSGKHPITGALRVAGRGIARLFPPLRRWVEMSARVESAAVRLVALDPGSITTAYLATALSWAALLAEYVLMTTFLGLSLSLGETIAALTAARLAFLTPLPGGLGVLEAGQVAALSLLGHDPAAGLSLGLLIRGRDLLFGSAGLILGGLPLGRKAAMDELLHESGTSSRPDTGQSP